MTSNNIESTYDALLSLTQTFSKIGSNPEYAKKARSQALITAKLPEPLKESIKGIMRVLEIQHDYFLKVSFNPFTKEFIGIKKPDIALVKGKPSIIIDGTVFPLTAESLSNKMLFIEERGNKNDKNLAYYLVYRGEVEGTEYLPLSLWNDPETSLDTTKLKKSIDYLTNSLYEYIFPVSVLEPGEYTVEKYGKLGKFTCMKINGLLYHAKPKHIDELNDLKLQDKPLEFIVTPERSIEKDGVIAKYKQSYVKGYAPATSIKKFVDSIGMLPSDDELKEKNLIIFEQPIELQLLNIGESIYLDKKQQTIEVSYKGQVANLIANSPIKRAIANGKFRIGENESYEGYKIVIFGVKPGNRGLEFQIKFEVPKVNFNESITGLMSELGFN